MRLYGYWRSSASWRVRIGLALKQVPYDYVAVDLRKGEQGAPDHDARNPLHRVPVLEWSAGGSVQRLTQSMAILHWLDARHPDPPLFPPDALLRARVIEVAEVINSGIQPLQNSSVLAAVARLGADQAAWAREHIGHGLRAVQRLSESLRGRFLCGDDLTVADLFLVPQMYNARRFGLDLASLGPLVEIDARLAEDPAFAVAHPDRQPDADRPQE